ncbi:hypothetical protein ACF3OC_10945 [Sphingobacterium cellulitidis]|uniref:hypothetical protein n=1 Tax=Sphingobacterium cellulitidis TaxID=1768011 RepID=UPI00370D8EA7
MTLNSQGFNKLNQLFIQCPYCSSEFWMGFDENMNLRIISNPKLTEEIPVKIEGDNLPVIEEDIPDKEEENIIADQDLTVKKKNLSIVELIVIMAFIFCAFYLIISYVK